jgi:hypothetical protein
MKPGFLLNLILIGKRLYVLYFKPSYFLTCLKLYIFHLTKHNYLAIFEVKIVVQSFLSILL